MSWSCNQFEARLSDYLEGALAAEERAAADAHARTCGHCAEWAQARRATLLLRELEELESPPGLETRILANTTGTSAAPSFWATLLAGWRLLAQPRFALGLAAGLFSLTLVLSTLGVSLGEIEAADLNPVNVYYALDRQASLAYAHGARFMSDLRLVYEIRTRLEELAPDTQPPAAGEPSQEPSPPPANEEDEQPNPGTSARLNTLLAYHSLGVTR